MNTLIIVALTLISVLVLSNETMRQAAIETYKYFSAEGGVCKNATNGNHSSNHRPPLCHHLPEPQRTKE